jgi:S-adenosylmethionine/arginine decarboxylase-like enzyme
MRKTLRIRIKSRKTRKKRDIQHHHLLLRLETGTCPGPADTDKAGVLLEEIIRDIDMKPLDSARVYYVSSPPENEGLTAILPIQTSHIAFHFWAKPSPVILKSKGSRCLLEFDLYTCGSLQKKQIQKILHHLTVFRPTRADITVLNRRWSLSIDRHTHWSADDGISWATWIDSHF